MHTLTVAQDLLGGLQRGWWVKMWLGRLHFRGRTLSRCVCSQAALSAVLGWKHRQPGKREPVLHPISGAGAPRQPSWPSPLAPMVALPREGWSVWPSAFRTGLSVCPVGRVATHGHRGPSSSIQVPQSQCPPPLPTGRRVAAWARRSRSHPASHLVTTLV